VSAAQPMESVRRRRIPGMASQAAEPVAVELATATPPLTPGYAGARPALGRQRSTDYGVTRLVNFRLPVDLHDRFRELVRECEQRHPRLRKASLTELVIALLEEGRQTADEVAELIRRKRLAEHGDEA
jgi:hypothetical protein